MARIKYNEDAIKYISMFESLSGAKIKDCILNESLIFIVHENEMGKAIGKNGSNIKRMENAIKKKIRLIEFNSDVCQFVSNLIYPLKSDDIKEENKSVKIYSKDTKTKGMIIGRDRHHLNAINDIVKRYFDIDGVNVVS
ncbi:NusA-like transcription termination signal-binding factor [Candidatus Woesearchaeota archaeon]|nr:NusA-like transcription termination signal-binding factor [Candidatus Woesearchaeota archaeon]